MAGGTAVYDQPEARIDYTTLLTAIWVLFAIATCFYAARLYIRLSTFHHVYTDDGFTTFALALLVVNAIITTIMAPPMYELIHISLKLGDPTPEFFERASLYLKLQFASTLVFWTCLWSIKAAFLAFFYRLTDNLKKVRIVWWIVTVLTTLFYIGSVITYPVSCSNFELGQCDAPRNIRLSLFSLRFSTAVDVISDAMIIAIPSYLCWRVRISAKQKAGLYMVLTVGVIIIAFSIARILVTDKHRKHPEITWLALWSSIESSVAVIVACMVSFKTLLSEQRRPQSHAKSSDRDGRGRRSCEPLGVVGDTANTDSRSREFRRSRKDPYALELAGLDDNDDDDDDNGNFAGPVSRSTTDKWTSEDGSHKASNPDRDSAEQDFG